MKARKRITTAHQVLDGVPVLVQSSHVNVCCYCEAEHQYDLTPFDAVSYWLTVTLIRAGRNARP